MKWRDWLSASVARRSHALEEEDEAMALWLTARDGALNIATIVCLCYIVEVWQGPDYYFDNATVSSFLTKRMFVPSKSIPEEEKLIGLLLPDYSGIATIQMLWDWMDASIVPTFAVPEPQVLMSHRLLGKVRLRQLRVKGRTCDMRELFDGVFAECYGRYTDDNENKESFAAAEASLQRRRHGQAKQVTASAWEWSSAESLGGTSFTADVDRYGGGGFYVDLPRDQNKTMELLRELRDGVWLDEATRMVFVDINMYNPNHHVFVTVNLYIEIPPTAGLLPRVLVNTLKLLNDQHCQVTADVMLLALSLWTLLGQAVEMAARGASGYFKILAHYMHLTGAVVGAVLGIMEIVYKCWEPDTDRALLALRSEEFVDLLARRYSYNTLRYAAIMTLFLTCGRLLFLSDFGRYSKLTSTLYRSMPNILSFSFMFAILMCSFSMMAYLVFGTDLYDFRTFISSLFVLVEVIIGQLDYKSLSTTNRFLGPLFYMAFIFFVVFVLYNMFIVILNDTYFIVREEAVEAEEPEMYEVMPFVKHCLLNLWAWLRLPRLRRAKARPRRLVKLRALRTLLLDCKVPRKAVDDFIWLMVNDGGSKGHVDKEQASKMAERVTQDLWQQPASWEYFMMMSQRLGEVERGVRALDRALDDLLHDLR